jgi:hypothetical protein
MDQVEVQQRIKLITQVRDLFNKPRDADVTELFFKASQHIPLEVFEKGLMSLASSATFMPNPGELSERTGYYPCLPSAKESNAEMNRRWQGKRH